MNLLFSLFPLKKMFSLSLLFFILLFIPGEILSQAPTITSFTPTQVCTGENITITGTNFTGATSVTIAGLAATFVVNNATTITATANSAGTGSVIITTPVAPPATSTGQVTVLQSPTPILNDLSNPSDPFTNCDGNSNYTITVSNGSTCVGNCNYTINWGDASTAFTQSNWPSGAQVSHTFNSQGYFNIVLTISSPNGCSKSRTFRFYNGTNPLASFTTTTPTTGLCVPASIEFQIGNWFGNSTGTTYELDFGDRSTPITLNHPLNTTNIFYLTSHLYTTTSCPASPDFTAILKAINGCFTTTYTLNQIVIRKKPVPNFTANPNPVCVGSPVCFTNTTTDGYSGNSCSTFSSFDWDFGDGSPHSTQETPTCHTYSSTGTYIVKLKASNAACGDSSISKTVTVNPVTPLPTVTTPVNYCQFQNASPLSATGNGLLWYHSLSGNGSSTPITPLTNTAGTQTYYVTQTINGCESQKAAITVNVNAGPAAPVVISPVQYCQNQVATQLTTTGTGLLWYTSVSGGTGNPTAPTPLTSTLGTTTYYVSQTTNSCASPRASIDVVINSVANPPVVTSPVNYCQNDVAAPLTASGSSLLWYNVSSGGTGTSTAPTPSTSTVGSTAYYVSQVTGCGESQRSLITVIVSTRPAASISYPLTNLCNVINSSATPNPPVPVTFSGTLGGTYSVSPSTGLSVNSTTGIIDPSGATPGNYTVSYTISSSGSCPAVTANATVAVNGTPSASISYPSMCTSNSATNAVSSGSGGGRYTSSAGLTIDNVTGTIIPSTSTPGIYVVTYTILPSPPCPGFTITTNVTITQAPSATIAYPSSNLCNVPNTATTPNPPVNVTLTGTLGGTYSVSPSTGLSVNSTTGIIDPSGATAGNYTISYTISSSGSCPAVTANATVVVNGTPTASISYPPICTSDAATNVVFNGSGGGNYTSPAGLSIDNLTGTITPSTSTPGTYVVTYTILPSPPCPGFTTTTNVTITQAPSATIAYPSSNLCNVPNTATTPNPPVAVTLTGATGGNYSISPATGLPVNASTGELSPAGATAGQYVITYTITGAGGCTNFSTSANISISDAPTATISYPGSAYCGGLTVPQAVTLTGSPGGNFSSSLALSLNQTTGGINPAASTPGTYIVTYTILPSPPCPGYVTTVSVTINESPAVTFPDTSKTICSGGTLIYTPVSSVPGTIYNWSVVGGVLPPGINGDLSGTTSAANQNIEVAFSNTGTSSQVVSFEVIPVNPAANPCNGAPKYLTGIINPNPTAPTVTDTVGYCLGTPGVPLAAVATPGNQLNWYDENMIALSSAPAPITTMPAQFIYYVSQSAGMCEGPKAKITAIVYPTPKIVSSSYTNPTSCGLPSGSIHLNILDLNNNPIPNTPIFIYYDKFQTQYKIADSTDASGNISLLLTAGTYSGIYVEVSGCTSQKIPDVFILKDPTPPATPTAGYNPPLCSERTLNLSASSATSNVTSPVDYVWVGPAFGNSPDTTRNTVFSFSSADASLAGTYIVYAIQNNCISPDTSFAVTINQSPSKPVITTRNPLCIGDNLNLQSVSSLPGAPPNATLIYTWSGPGRGFPVTSAYAQINSVIIADAGTYTTTVYSPATGCTSKTDTLIQIGGYPVVQLNAGSSLELPTGHLLDLSSTIINAGDPHILPMKLYDWSPNVDMQCNDPICSAPLATIKNDGCYSVTATNIYGCSGRDTICVKVFCKQAQVFIPNAFTPAGGLPENSVFMVRGSGISSVSSFRIFNRWGQIVFERSNCPPNSPEYGWDGKVNKVPAEPGVFVYIVEVVCENGIRYTYKGNVTLIK